MDTKEVPYYIINKSINLILVFMIIVGALYFFSQIMCFWFSLPKIY